MTEKLINIGIFWLPLMAGIILGGMSPSVWYGGDKIAALWMTFFGIALLLLTATFQIQSYIQTTILQPQLELKPVQKSILTWNPPQDNSMNIRGENDDIPRGNWKVPVFAIRNTTPVNAQDVTIKWSAAKYDPSTLTANAPIFQDRGVSISSHAITLSAPNGIPFRNQFFFAATDSKPFITRSAETYIPLEVWNTGALFFLATLPAESGARSEPYYFDVEISWSIPENTKPARYRIKAVATNAKPAGAQSPALVATIEFFVEPES
jgi:hypothetical protein